MFYQSARYIYLKSKWNLPATWAAASNIVAISVKTFHVTATHCCIFFFRQALITTKVSLNWKKSLFEKFDLNSQFLYFVKNIKLNKFCCQILIINWLSLWIVIESSEIFMKLKDPIFNFCVFLKIFLIFLNWNLWFYIRY